MCQRPTASDGSCNYCLLQLGKSDRQPITSPLDADLPSPQQLQRSFPQLEITRLIGRGGMGAIYHARQRSLERDVALKIIARDVSNDPAFEERFTREAKTLARLSHPNIVTIHDFGSTEDGLVYLLMEYVDGVNLREAMDAGCIRSDEAIKIIEEMCAALQFAHDRGVVHRDIKPENVLLNEDGIVKVADFGLAKFLSDSPGNLTLTNTRQVMGTLRYMAPEQFEDPSSVDHRADVYSLGVVFYELLTGQVPVGRFDAPSRVNQSVSPRLDEIVMRTLDRKPPNRYQRVSEIASELSDMEFVSDVSRSLPPPSRAPEAQSSLAFSASTLGNLAVSIGNLKLEGDSLEMNYLTRDNIFRIVKSAAKSLRIPLSELSKLEWRPGVFSSTITITPKSLALAERLPSANDGCSELKVGLADSQAAAKLVFEASQRAPALRSISTNDVTQKIAQRESVSLSWARVSLGVLFFVCAALDFVGMIIILVALSNGMRSSETVVAKALVPIFSIATAVVQIIGGVFCFSPFTKRMPFAAGIVSMLPLAPSWPLGLFVGLWACRVLGRNEIDSDHDRGIPLLRGLLDGSNSRIHTTLMLIRESRWSKVVALANAVGLLLVGSIFAAYKTEYYPVIMKFRVVGDQWNSDNGVPEIRGRLQYLGNPETGTLDGAGQIVYVKCMKWNESNVRHALAISNRVEWAWVIEPETGAEISDTDIRATVGGTIKSDALVLTNSIRLGDKPLAIESNYCKSISRIGNELELNWTTEGRKAIDATKPDGKIIGLALIVEGLVEGVAPSDSIAVRSAKFSLAEGSKFEPEAIEAAIRGPALTMQLDFLRGNFGF